MRKLECGERVQRIAPTDTQLDMADVLSSSRTFLPSFRPSGRLSTLPQSGTGPRAPPLVVISNLPVGRDDRQFDWPGHDHDDQRSRDSGRSYKWNCAMPSLRVDITATGRSGRVGRSVIRSGQGRPPLQPCTRRPSSH